MAAPGVRVVQRTPSFANKVVSFFSGSGWGPINQGGPVPLQGNAYIRQIQDLQTRLSLQTLTADMIVAAQAQMTLGNASPMARISDALLQTDPEIKAAVKQLKTAVSGVEFVVTPPNDSTIAQAIADDVRLQTERPALGLRNVKGWIVEGRIRGGGLIETVWNDPASPKRLWDGFVAVPQQRYRINRWSGEPQFAPNPYVFQGTNISDFDPGKWLVVQPDQHIQDYALRGIIPALLSDWYGRLNAMGWWNMCLERDAMRTLVAHAGSDADAAAMDKAFQNRGAAAAYLMRDEKSNISSIDPTTNRSGVSPHGEYMNHTAQRMFLALLGESQTGIVTKVGGSSDTVQAQAEVAGYVIEDVCGDISEIIGRDLFLPYTIINYGEQNAENAPKWVAKLDEPVDIVTLNKAISTRPANVKLGVSWYRKQTQWPEPLTEEEPLDAPMPLPGQFPDGRPAGETEAPGDKPTDTETPADQKKEGAA